MQPGEFAWVSGIFITRNILTWPERRKKREGISLKIHSLALVYAVQRSSTFSYLPVHTFGVLKGKEKKQIIFLYISVVVLLWYTTGSGLSDLPVYSSKGQSGMWNVSGHMTILAVRSSTTQLPGSHSPTICIAIHGQQVAQLTGAVEYTDCISAEE